MNAPVATYRVQLNKEFDFNQLKKAVPYLAELGISHVYASPIFQARKGSRHGYDIVDFNTISKELGGAAGFKDLSNELASYGLEWIQDIVPNHMAYTPENRMISDVLKKGTASAYYEFPDVDWNHPSKRLKGKILAPFLEDTYKNCLKRGEIRLVHEGENLLVEYKSTRFPLKEDTYEDLHSKKKHEYCVDAKCLDELLSKQIFALAPWKTALRLIDYRRFFDVADLISLHTEKPEVFEATHHLLFELMEEGKISGLRIDHVDGLYDPEEYIGRLRREKLDAFMIVEKILGDNEDLPQAWLVQGTTGYDFLNHVNDVFVEAENEAEFEAAYRKFTRDKKTFKQHQYELKKKVAQRYFCGDLDNLAWLLERALPSDNYTHEILREALLELFSCFPVYRTYLTQRNASANEPAEYLEKALSSAKKTNPKAKRALASIEKLLAERAHRLEAMEFFIRLQQFTGAIMAKGVEDTAFYVYNRLISLNEVGGNPARLGTSTDQFHKFIHRRQEKWPVSMNATSTHDCKRGEDTRARLNVLSEIPEETFLNAQRWATLNAPKKKRIGGKFAPDRNEEYYLYQTLLGAFPFDEAEIPKFAERLRRHMMKAIREAKRNSSWLSPQLCYEEAVTEFAAELLNPKKGSDFLKDFVPFQKEIAYYGVFNSLSQTLTKITCVGTPDFYQGAELWDLNLVDPDNRRPVNFHKRKQLLNEVLNVDPLAISTMLGKPADGKVKLYLICKALKARRKEKALFEKGTYIPLEVQGMHSKNILSFCRKRGKSFSITVVPRFLTTLLKPSDSFGAINWGNTRIRLPPGAPQNWKNVFTETQIASKRNEQEEHLNLSNILETFPVSLLLSGEQ